jgi:uncharacterized protein (DUF305 family)
MGSDHSGDDSAMSGTAMGSGAQTTGSGHSGTMMGATSTPMSEQAFLEDMVPHHESAIAMAELALTKAQHPEVRSLAKNIVSSQQAEIAQMKAWHQAWFGSELQMGAGATMDMSPLEMASGDEFDRVFLAMMIPHHASAVTMADSVKMSEPRARVVELANGIISAQAKEIGEMQQWRERWYPPVG